MHRVIRLPRICVQKAVHLRCYSLWVSQQTSFSKGFPAVNQNLWDFIRQIHDFSCYRNDRQPRHTAHKQWIFPVWKPHCSAATKISAHWRHRHEAYSLSKYPSRSISDDLLQPCDDGRSLFTGFIIISLQLLHFASGSISSNECSFQGHLVLNRLPLSPLLFL